MPTNFSRVDVLVDQVMRAGLTALGQDILKRAQILAPKGDPKTDPHSGALIQSGQYQAPSPDRVVVSFGNNDVQYARIRHYINNLHPATRMYLTNALKSETDLTRFFPRLF